MPDPTPDLTPLELEILIALGSGPLHGYAIIQDIEERTASFGDLRSGTLYLTLRRLRSGGLVEACDPPRGEEGGDARRKFVRLTDAGRRAAADRLTELRQTLEVAGARKLLRPRRA